jgi:putative copper export protein
MKRFSSARVAAVGAILLAGVLLATYLDARLQPAPAQTPLVEIKNIQTLRAQFNRDAGKTRLIVLVSPT